MFVALLIFTLARLVGGRLGAGFKSLNPMLDVNEKVAHALKSNAPTILFTKIDEENIHIDLTTEKKHYSIAFKLGEEKDIEKLDGEKIKVTYLMEAPNILKQIIRLPQGRTTYFRRIFEDNKMKMEVTIEGSDVTAYVYFAVME